MTGEELRHKEEKRLCQVDWSKIAFKPVITREYTLSLQSTLSGSQLDFFMVFKTEEGGQEGGNPTESHLENWSGCLSSGREAIYTVASSYPHPNK